MKDLFQCHGKNLHYQEWRNIIWMEISVWIPTWMLNNPQPFSQFYQSPWKNPGISTALSSASWEKSLGGKLNYSEKLPEANLGNPTVPYVVIN